MGGGRPGGGGLGGPSPSPLPEAWPDAVEIDLVVEPVGQGQPCSREKAWMGSGSQEAGPHRREEGGRRVGCQRTLPGASRLMLWGPRPLSGVTGCGTRTLSGRTWDACFPSKYELVRMGGRAS